MNEVYICPYCGTEITTQEKPVKFLKCLCCKSDILNTEGRGLFNAQEVEYFID